MHKTDQNVCIRKATLQDAALLTQIEAACFPAAEAATRDRFDARLEAFADHFLICVTPLIYPVFLFQLV